MQGFQRVLSKAYGAARAFRNHTIAWGFCIAAALPGLAAADPVRLVALGDSLTAGYGLPPEEGLVPQLQDWLKGQGVDVVIENAGVSGDTTAGGLARLDWSLGGGGQALMVILGGNDMLRGLRPEEVRRNLKGILDGAKAKGLPVLLVGMKAPTNFGPAYKEGFDAIYPELAAEYGTLYFEDFFTGYLTEGADFTDPASYAPLMQADGIHPNAKGVQVVIAALGPKVKELVEEVAP